MLVCSCSFSLLLFAARSGISKPSYNLKVMMLTKLLVIRVLLRNIFLLELSKFFLQKSKPLFLSFIFFIFNRLLFEFTYSIVSLQTLCSHLFKSLNQLSSIGMIPTWQKDYCSLMFFYFIISRFTQYLYYLLR